MKCKFKQFLSPKRVINVVENARLFKCPIVCIYQVLVSKFSVCELRPTSKSNRSTSDSSPTSLLEEKQKYIAGVVHRSSAANKKKKKFDQPGNSRPRFFKYASRDVRVWFTIVGERGEARGRMKHHFLSEESCMFRGFVHVVLSVCVCARGGGALQSGNLRFSAGYTSICLRTAASAFRATFCIYPPRSTRR